MSSIHPIMFKTHKNKNFSILIVASTTILAVNKCLFSSFLFTFQQIMWGNLLKLPWNTCSLSLSFSEDFATAILQIPLLLKETQGYLVLKIECTNRVKKVIHFYLQLNSIYFMKWEFSRQFVSLYIAFCKHAAKFPSR